MKKSRKFTALTLTLILVISTAGCSAKPTGNDGGDSQTITFVQPSASSEDGLSANPSELPSANQAITTSASPVASTSTTAPAKPSTSASATTPALPEPKEYHIGIVTFGGDSHYHDETLGAEALIAQYGSVEDGGMIKHRAGIHEAPEGQIYDIVRLADDPLMKAIIINPGDWLTADAIERIKDAGRDDIILLAQMPHPAKPLLYELADVVVSLDDFTRGYYDIARVKEMGASTFVHMTFPRHMSVEILSRRSNMFEEACKDLGIQFVSVTVPDPASEVSVADAQQQVYDLMPHLVDLYGKDAIYFSTNTALQKPIIKRVLELGGLFLNQDYPSDSFSYPGALGLDLTALRGDWWATTQEIEKDIISKGQSGRMGTFAYSFDYCGTTALFRLAVDMIEGKVSGDLKKDLLSAYQSETPGCEWRAEIFVDPEGAKIDNYYLLSMETYIFGKGFTSVFDMPLPEKYYSIK